MVLTQRFLFTFKAQQKYNESPTERLRVQEFVTIKSAEEIKKLSVVPGNGLTKINIYIEKKKI